MPTEVPQSEGDVPYPPHPLPMGELLVRAVLPAQTFLQLELGRLRLSRKTRSFASSPLL